MKVKGVGDLEHFILIKAAPLEVWSEQDPLICHTGLGAVYKH